MNKKLLAGIAIAVTSISFNSYSKDKIDRLYETLKSHPRIEKILDRIEEFERADGAKEEAKELQRVINEAAEPEWYMSINGMKKVCVGAAVGVVGGLIAGYNLFHK